MKTIIIFIKFSVLMILLTNCQKAERISVVPNVKVPEVKNITCTSALVNAEILSDGGSEVTSIGYCLSEGPDPIVMTKTGRNGGEDNKFDVPLENLKINTTYYLRIYATNDAGTGYSEVISFKTQTYVITETVQDIDGNVYPVIKVGNLLVMTQDLRTTRYRNGDPIPAMVNMQNWSSLSTGGRIVGKTTYYNWFAANDSRNIAPEGWRIPTKEELCAVITENTINYFPPKGYIEATTGLWKENIPGNGPITGNSLAGGFWSSSPDNQFVYSLGTVEIAWSVVFMDLPLPAEKQTGFPIRCIKEN